MRPARLISRLDKPILESCLKLEVRKTAKNANSGAFRGQALLWDVEGVSQYMKLSFAALKFCFTLMNNHTFFNTRLKMEQFFWAAEIQVSHFAFLRVVELAVSFQFIFIS